MSNISLSVVFIKKVSNFNKTWLKDIEYAESEFRTFEFVICKQIDELCQKRGFNGSTGVIGYAD